MLNALKKKMSGVEVSQAISLTHLPTPDIPYIIVKPS